MSARCPHCGGELEPNRVISWGGWELNEVDTKQVSRTDRVGEPVYLQTSLIQILGALLRAKGGLVTREALFNAVYYDRPDSDWPEIKIIDVYVAKLRAATRPLGLGDRIRTVWGRGYLLVGLETPVDVKMFRGARAKSGVRHSYLNGRN